MLSSVKFVFLIASASGLEAGTQAWTAAGVQQLQGALLDGQYVLEAPIPNTRHEIEVESFVEVDAEAALEKRSTVRSEQKASQTGHGNPPSEITSRYTGMEYLRSGSFGEAWSAYDSVNGRRTPVVIKIFYTTTATGIRYLSRNLVARSRSLRNAIQEAVTECELANKIATKGPDGDPGKDRVVKCLKNKADRSRPADDALYLVLEHGGTSVEEWIKDESYKATVDEKRKVVGQLLQGLRTMGELLPQKLVHHDLKPANSVYDGTTAKLIDFGGTMVGDRANMYEPAVASKAYAPPEFLGTVPGRAKVAFEFNERAGTLGVSYDVYAMGMIYAEVMCGGKVTFMDLYQFARAEYKTKQQLEVILRRGGCTLTNTDLNPILRMLAFRASDRPKPSEVLNAAPFSEPDMQVLLGEVAEDLEASVDAGDAEDLLASIVPKNEYNPNVRGGRGVVYQFDKAAADMSGWESGKMCQLNVQARQLISLNDPVWKKGGSTRAICEEKCIASEKDDSWRLSVFKEMRAQQDTDMSQFCCQLNVRDDGSGKNAGRTCDYGWGELIAFDAFGRADKINSWARHLPFSEAAPDVEVDMPLNMGRGAAQRQFEVGDAVRVRDQPSHRWRKATVSRIVHGEVYCRVPGWDRSYTFKYVEKLMKSNVRAEPVRPSNAVAAPKARAAVAEPEPKVVWRGDLDDAAAKGRCEADGGECKYVCSSGDVWGKMGAAGGCGSNDFCCTKPQCHTDGGNCRRHCERGEIWRYGDTYEATGQFGCESLDYCCVDSAPERERYAKGQRVRVRDDPSTWHQAFAIKEWVYGIVDDPEGPRVIVDGKTYPYTYDQVEKVADRPIKPGSHVQMKFNKDDRAWEYGVAQASVSAAHRYTAVRENGATRSRSYELVYPIDAVNGNEYYVRRVGTDVWRDATMTDATILEVELLRYGKKDKLVLDDEWEIKPGQKVTAV